MFIGIDEKFRIRLIAESRQQVGNTKLTIIEVDREKVFGNWTDRRIFAHCYRPFNDGSYQLYAGRDLTEINIMDNAEKFENEIKRAEQFITAQDLLNIENGIKITELDLKILEMEAISNE